MSEKQRDEALGTIKALNDKVEKLKIYSFKADDLRGMPIQKLKTLQVSVSPSATCSTSSNFRYFFSFQSKLRGDLEEVDKILYSLTATKCMKCEENKRTVTLAPCNHYVLCEACAMQCRECPYCQTPIERTNST